MTPPGVRRCSGPLPLRQERVAEGRERAARSGRGCFVWATSPGVATPGYAKGYLFEVHALVTSIRGSFLPGVATPGLVRQTGFRGGDAGPGVDIPGYARSHLFEGTLRVFLARGRNPGPRSRHEPAHPAATLTPAFGHPSPTAVGEGTKCDLRLLRFVPVTQMAGAFALPGGRNRLTFCPRRLTCSQMSDRFSTSPPVSGQRCSEKGPCSHDRGD
jgi:hypothetical protein